MSVIQAPQAIATAVITITNPGEASQEHTIYFHPLPADQQPGTPADAKEQ